MSYIEKIRDNMKLATKTIATSSAKERNFALEKIADSLLAMQEEILKANEEDIRIAREHNMSEAMIDRLKLTKERIEDMVASIKQVILLKDPIGASTRAWTLENGLYISKVSAPLGIISIIYESRPNVTVEATSLALKSANAILLRGSSSAINTNIVLEKAIHRGLEASNISKDVVHLVKDSDRNVVTEIIRANGFIDLVIPRGGASLINKVVMEATVPTLETGEGNNHLYIDEFANLDMSLKVLMNAKMQRVSVCNAVEKLLLHKKIAQEFLAMFTKETKDKLELRADKTAKDLLPSAPEISSEEELKKEYLDYILGVKIVDNIDEAIEHINKYGTKHSEAIITDNIFRAEKFQKEVDAAVVYVNASTRFTDGGQFGFGGEMGISTQKMHARGPVGLEELVTHKYIAVGNGQVR